MSWPGGMVLQSRNLKILVCNSTDIPLALTAKKILGILFSSGDAVGFHHLRFLHVMTLGVAEVCVNLGEQFD
jgi:hypothetical protein